MTRHPPSRPRDTPPDWHLHPQLADDTHPLAHWPLCDVLLMDNLNHPWLILVPRVTDAREIIDLDVDRQMLFMGEIARASRALRAACTPQPDKLNVAALGNMVPQLHVHVIARYRNDIAWPRPVWGTATAQPYSPEGLIACVHSLQTAFQSA